MTVEYEKAISKINKIDSAYFAKNQIILLEGIEVTARKDSEKEGYQRGQAHGSPTRRIEITEENQTEFIGTSPIAQILSRFPGVTVRGSNGNYIVNV